MRQERVAVVVNGNAQGATPALVSVLGEMVGHGDLFVTRSLEEGRRAAVEIASRGYELVLMGGGDGTFSQMVTAVVRSCHDQGQPLPRFGVLRLGTGNAVAWALGAQKHPRGAVDDLARLRRGGGHRSLRLLEVNDTLAPFAGIGMDALALRHFNETREVMARIPVLGAYTRGGVSYFVSIVGRTLPEMLVRPHAHMRVVNEGADAFLVGAHGQAVGPPIRRGETIFEGRARAVTFASIPYWGFGSRVFPFAEAREDRFNLRVVNLESLDVALNIRSIWNGTFRTPRLQDFLVDAVRIESRETLPVQVGGDPAGMSRSLRARLYPEPIGVVDFHAPAPPSADALTTRPELG